jgi:hypothetical protein
MKKLLLLLLCVPFILLYNSCSPGGSSVPPPITQTLSQTLVGQIWQIKDGQERFYLDDNDGKLYQKDLLCDTFSVIGDWILDGDSLRFSYFDGPLFINQLFGVIDTFSSTEISFLVDNSPTTQVNIIYQLVDEVIRGCMDSNSSNYNSSATCDENCLYGKTYVPDDNFENYLEANGMGDGIALNDSVYTHNINTVTDLHAYPPFNTQIITDLTGIEGFSALEILWCYENQLTSLDVSQNTALRKLYCHENQLTSLNISGATALTDLNCTVNQLTSLDVSNNTSLTELNCIMNQLTSLDLSNNTALDYLNCYGNQLTSLDVSQNTALRTLYCYENQLTSLDLSNNTALTHLGCRTNELTSLDVSNTALISLHLNPNPNLTCIKVHDVSWANSIEHLNIDAHHYFSQTCP